MAGSSASASRVQPESSWPSGEERKAEAAAGAAKAARAAEGALDAGCNGCCSRPAAAEEAEAAASRPLCASGKLSWALGAGSLALLLALGVRLAGSAAGPEAPRGPGGSSGDGDDGGAGSPLPGRALRGGGGGGGCCLLLAASFWLGWESGRAGLRLRAAAWLLAACCGGEALAQLGLALAGEAAAAEAREARPLLLASSAATGVVLGCLAGGTWLARLRLRHGVLLLASTSALRLASLVSLEGVVRAPWRPYLAYLLGFLGILVAGYARRAARGKDGRRAEAAEAEEGGGGGGGGDPEGADGAERGGPAARPARAEAPGFKRRRRSSSMISAEMAGCGNKSHRRTSLPCIPREQIHCCNPAESVCASPALIHHLFNLDAAKWRRRGKSRDGVIKRLHKKELLCQRLCSLNYACNKIIAVNQTYFSNK